MAKSSYVIKRCCRCGKNVLVDVEYIKDDVTCNRLCCAVVHDGSLMKNSRIYGFDKVSYSMLPLVLKKERSQKKEKLEMCTCCNEYFYKGNLNISVCEVCNRGRRFTL